MVVIIVLLVTFPLSETYVVFVIMVLFTEEFFESFKVGNAISGFGF